MILHLDDNISMTTAAIIDIYLEPGRGSQGRMLTMCIWEGGPPSFLLCESTMINTIYESDSLHKNETMLRNWYVFIYQGGHRLEMYLWTWVV